MPGGNRTGPAGMGPMTGRGAGYCSGSAVPGYMSGGFGRGSWGWGGRGGGRGRRNWYYATGLTGWQRAAWGQPGWGGYGSWAPPTPWGLDITPQQELDSLKAQAEYLGDMLKQAQKRIDELEARASQDEQ